MLNGLAVQRQNQEILGLGADPELSELESNTSLHIQTSRSFPPYCFNVCFSSRFGTTRKMFFCTVACGWPYFFFFFLRWRDNQMYTKKFLICFCVQEALFTEVLFFVFSAYTLHYPTQVNHVTVSCLVWPRPALCTLLPSWPIVRKDEGNPCTHTPPISSWSLMSSPLLTRSDIHTDKERAGDGQDVISCPCPKENWMVRARECREWMGGGRVLGRESSRRQRHTQKDWREKQRHV